MRQHAHGDQQARPEVVHAQQLQVQRQKRHGLPRNVPHNPLGSTKTAQTGIDCAQC